MRQVPLFVAAWLLSATCLFAQSGPAQARVSSKGSAGTTPASSADSRPVQTQSHPAWWMYVSPEATAIVGIQWNYLQSSPLAEAVAAELSPVGSIPFPDWEFLPNTQQILIASPALMAIASGAFPAGLVRGSATAKGFKKTQYKGVEIWVAPQTASAIASSSVTMSIARISEQIILFGHVATLKDAIDRGLETGKKRDYSPLLAQAARFAKQDLWVVAARLPDPLANLFVPLDVQARSFEGALSIWDGLHVVAALDAGTGAAAEMTADRIWETLPSSDTFENATEITTDGATVQVKIDLDEPQFLATLRKREEPTVIPVKQMSPAPSRSETKAQSVEAKSLKPSASVATPAIQSPAVQAPVIQPRLKAPEPPAAVQAVAIPVPASPVEAAKPSVPASPPSQPKLEEPKPKVVHIYGLEGGPKDVQLPGPQ